MNKLLSVALALVCIVGSGVAAHAEEGTIRVNVPFEFVVGNQTLPAGSYTVARISSDTNSPLIVFNRKSGVILLPLAFNSVGAHDVHLSFTHVGGKYLLSQVETLVGTYNLGINGEVTRLAQAQQHRSMTSSGSN
jgi:hypothetical protein